MIRYNNIVAPLDPYGLIPSSAAPKEWEDYKVFVKAIETAMRSSLQSKFKHCRVDRLYFRSLSNEEGFVVEIDSKYVRAVGRTRLGECLYQMMEVVHPLEEDYQSGRRDKVFCFIFIPKKLSIPLEQYRALERSQDLF